jgi:chemotaxis signal transduction protein
VNPQREQWFCLFRGDTVPLGVSMESVAEVLQTDSLVRLPWSPPQVVGMCSYHREVVPVVTLGDLSREVSKYHVEERDERDQAGANGSPRTNGAIEDRTGCVVLILKTEHGAWGLRVDSANTIMSRESPEFDAPQMNASGAVLVGSVCRAGTCYGIIDAEATWRGLRSSVGRWLALTGEILPSSLMPSGEEPIQAGPGARGGQLEA